MNRLNVQQRKRNIKQLDMSLVKEDLNEQFETSRQGSRVIIQPEEQVSTQEQEQSPPQRIPIRKPTQKKSKHIQIVQAKSSSSESSCSERSSDISSEDEEEEKDEKKDQIKDLIQHSQKLKQQRSLRLSILDFLVSENRLSSKKSQSVQLVQGEEFHISKKIIFKESCLGELFCKKVQCGQFKFYSVEHLTSEADTTRTRNNTAISFADYTTQNRLFSPSSQHKKKFMGFGDAINIALKMSKNLSKQKTIQKSISDSEEQSQSSESFDLDVKRQDRSATTDLSEKEKNSIKRATELLELGGRKRATTTTDFQDSYQIRKKVENQDWKQRIVEKVKKVNLKDRLNDAYYKIGRLLEDDDDENQIDKSMRMQMKQLSQQGEIRLRFILACCIGGLGFTLILFILSFMMVYW